MRKAVVVDGNIMIRSILGVKVSQIMEEFESVAYFIAPDVCFDDAHKYTYQLAQKRGIDLELVGQGFQQVERITVKSLSLG